ncbi:MAG: hypothetical protein AYK22_06545 [Thermoplasmatales archaeon SG8-52-3]|nr:MAG: hypothetical protein AYK22_06545 [Thermoplasmatales archaeon SG8-52-3]
MCLAISTIPIGIIGGIEGFESSYFLIGLIFLVTFAASIMISYFITRPLEKLTDNIIEISKGKLDVTLAPSEIHEINKLTDSLNRIMASLKLAIHKVGVKKGEIFEDELAFKDSSLQKKDDIFDIISGWTWETDSKGNYTFCSGNVKKFLGYNPDEIVGKSFFDIISSENVEKTKRVFNEALKEKNPIDNLENLVVNKNGDKIYVRTNGMPLLDDSGNLIGYKGIITDISSEKEAENKINELNTKLSDLKNEIAKFSNCNQSEDRSEPLDDEPIKPEEKLKEHQIGYIFLFDENANILACTDSMYEKLGYTKDEMLSLNITDFDALETKQDIKEKLERAKKEGHFSFKTMHKKKDGSTFLVYESFQYLKDKDAFRCIVKED